MRSTVAGVATFVGQVAGTRYVVVAVSGSMLVTHGRLEQTLVRKGDAIAVGQDIGRAGVALYIGVRINGKYLDPQSCSADLKSGVPRAVLVAG